MGSGGSPTQKKYNNYDYDPRSWQNALQVLQEQDNNLQYGTGAVNDFQNYQQQANDYQQQTPQTFGQSVIDFNQLAREQTPSIPQPYSMQYQAPQSYVSSNIDVNQLFGQQGQPQGYNALQQFIQQPQVQQQNRQAPARNSNNAFGNAMNIVFQNEGGYSNHKNDSGGRTNLGITQGLLNGAQRQGITKVKDVTQLTRDEAMKIYNEMFWKKYQANQLPEAIAIPYFDALVNHGTGGVKLLQKAINSFAGENIVAVDGQAGTQTINAVNSLITDDNKLHRFLNIFHDLRGQLYDSLAKSKPKNRVFLKGWHNRNQRMRDWGNQQSLGNSAPAQAQVPNITPGPDNSGIDFSQDILQSIPQAKTNGLYPNFYDYLTSPAYYQMQKHQWGGLNY